MTLWGRLPFAVLVAASVAGCGDFLAPINPCGGITPADGFAEIFGAKVAGDIELVSSSGTSTRAFNSNRGIGYAACSTFVSGLASEDGSATTDVEVSCPRVTVSFTLPDVRFLDRGATASLATTVTLADGTTFDATASLKIHRAEGGQEPSPGFVSADFLRSGEIELVPTTAAGDAGSSAAQVIVHAHIELVADDYSQASQAGEDHCPELPSK